ncbi:MAG TPA: IS110 family transposase [Niabella sp.]|nr:IS110 family transposase [Niabella sp.]
MKILKQVAGIDVAQNELAVSAGRLKEDLTIEIYGFKTFPNTQKGFGELAEWVKKKTVAEVPVRFVMEATGVYHESLAYYLVDHKQLVSIVMPNKMSNYRKTLQIKTVTDKTASQVIASFGLEKNLDTWQKPKQVYRDLRQITRERGQLIEERTALKNQLHAEQSEAFPNPKSIGRIQERIKLLNRQEKEIMQEISAFINQDKEVRMLAVLVGSVPGIGLLTAAIILSETNGFELIRNKKQLTSYAGLDVKEKESGTSVKSKPKISKKGNKYIRKAMHFPALTAIRHDERFKAIYARLVQKHGIKMKAAVAVQRKLLELTYTIYKNNKPYDKEYLKQTQANNKNEVAA